MNCCFIVSYTHTGLFKNTKHTSGTGSNKEAFSPGITLGRYGDRSCKEQKKTKQSIQIIKKKLWKALVLLNGLMIFRLSPCTFWSVSEYMFPMI